MSNDPYDCGIPKYLTAQDIYDALCELVQTEEMNLLAEMGADVSYESQTYYYTDKGDVLKEKFEELSDYGNKMWLMDLAIWKIENNEEEYGAEVHDIVFEALNDDDLAKRIGFKKLFVEHLLYGNAKLYSEVAEAYNNALRELDGFNYYRNSNTFFNTIDSCGNPIYINPNNNPYGEFSRHLYKKVSGLQMEKEMHLIAECRALLTSYDDFILGLRMNQALHNQLEQQYQARVAQLQASYDEKIKQLLAIADSKGLIAGPNQSITLLETIDCT